jgi:hypothetical protein
MLIVDLKASDALVYTLIHGDGRRHAPTPLPKAAFAVDEHPQTATRCHKGHEYDDAKQWHQRASWIGAHSIRLRVPNGLFGFCILM